MKVFLVLTRCAPTTEAISEQFSLRAASLRFRPKAMLAAFFVALPSLAPSPARRSLSACALWQPSRSRTIAIAGGPGCARLTALAAERRGARVVQIKDLEGDEEIAVDAAVYAVGAGAADLSTELKRWAAAKTSFSNLGPHVVGLFVTRQLCCADVARMLKSDNVQGQWLVIRPGALVPDEEAEKEQWWRERALLTTDIRPNGLVSRTFLGEVLAAIALGEIASPLPFGQVVGLYDLKRMIFHPQGTPNLLIPHDGREI